MNETCSSNANRGQDPRQIALGVLLTVGSADVAFSDDRVVVQGDLPRRQRGALDLEATSLTVKATIFGVQLGSVGGVVAELVVFDGLR